MTKNLEGGSHIHIPLRFFEITGLFRDQQHKKTCYKALSQSLTKAHSHWQCMYYTNACFFSLSLLATAINSARLDTSTLPSVSDSEYINIIYWGNIWRKRLNETKSTKLENSFSCSTGVWTLAYAQRFCQINNKDKRVLTSVKCHEF